MTNQKKKNPQPQKIRLAEIDRDLSVSEAFSIIDQRMNNLLRLTQVMMERLEFLGSPAAGVSNGISAAPRIIVPRN